MFSKKETVVISVPGMMCKNCAKHVNDALVSLDGVKKVAVSLDDKKVTVTIKEGTDKNSLISALASAGYKAEF